MTHDVQYAEAERAKLARRDSATPLELVEQLGQALDRLENQHTRLGQRLEPVLVEAAPSPALIGEPSPGRTALSQRLTHHVAWAERLADQAGELGDRIEL